LLEESGRIAEHLHIRAKLCNPLSPDLEPRSNEPVCIDVTLAVRDHAKLIDLNIRLRRWRLDRRIGYSLLVFQLCDSPIPD
jgi:hypothetical protein